MFKFLKPKKKPIDLLIERLEYELKSPWAYNDDKFTFRKVIRWAIQYRDYKKEI